MNNFFVFIFDNVCRKRHHRRNLDNTHLPAKVKQSLRKRQRLCEFLTAFSLLAALVLIVAAPLLLIPILSDFQNQALTFTVYLCACCIGAALCILAAACFGNFYWYFDRRRGQISWFMHCGTGPFDYYWGKAFSKESPQSVPRTIHGVYLRSSQRSSGVAVVQVQPHGIYSMPAAVKMASIGSSAYPMMMEHGSTLANDMTNAIQEEDEECASDCESSADSDSTRSQNTPLRSHPTAPTSDNPRRPDADKPSDSDSEVKIIISRAETASPVYEEPLQMPIKRMLTPPID